MSYHPDTPENGPTRGQKAIKAVKETVAAAAKIQRQDPVGTALWPFLMAVEVALLFGLRVRAELWGVLFVLAALKAHEWAVENAHRHPLLVDLFARSRKKK